MACNDDFSLLEDEAQSPHPYPHQQHPPASAPVSAVPIRSRSLSSTNINGKKVPASSLGESDVNLYSHLDPIREDDDSQLNSPAARSLSLNNINGKKLPAGILGDSDANLYSHLDPIRDDDDSDLKSPASIPHIHLLRASSSESKRMDRDELGDCEPLYGLKRLRSSSGEHRKDREEWSDLEIGCLVDVFAAKCVRMKRGNLRGRDWEDVVAMVNERCGKKDSGRTVEQCKNKIDNLKKRYKVERQRISGGRIGVSNWLWFKKMEKIVGSSSSSKSAVDDGGAAFGGDSSPVSRQMKRLHPGTSPGSTSLTCNIKLKSLPNPRWKRVVLIISGAALAGQSGSQNVDPKVMMLIAREVAMASHVGVEVAIVVGRRNFFCSDTWLASADTDKTTAYQISMMASTMNAVLLQASFEKIGVETRVQTAFMMESIADVYIRRRAIRHLEKGRIVIFGGIGSSTGSQFLTTDAATALRASEINADVLMKGITSDGVHGCHSRDESSAFEHISFRDLVARGFASMDMTAVSYCEESKIPVVLFNLLEPGNISRALCGDQIGLLIDH